MIRHKCNYICTYVGPALFRLCCAEMIKVDVPEEGDVTAAMRRTDHIASIGRVKHRVEALSRYILHVYWSFM